MINLKYRMWPILFVSFGILLGCSGANSDEQDSTLQIDNKSEGSYEYVNRRLYHSADSGLYYFQFLHGEPGDTSFYVYTPIVDKGGIALDIDTANYGYYFGFYTDQQIAFRLTSKHEDYSYRELDFNELVDYCYYNGSYYRVGEGVVEHYQIGYDTDCYLFPGAIQKFEMPQGEVKRVYKWNGHECLVATDFVLIDGCLLDSSNDEFGSPTFFDTLSTGVIEYAVWCP